MKQNIPAEWSKTESIVFRLVFCYLLCYFVFLDSFFVDFFPLLNYLHIPFRYISDIFISSVNRLIIHNHYGKDVYTGMGDTTWICIAILSYLVVSIIAATMWTLFDKRKSHIKLFSYLHLYARYYLAFVLFVYGIAKLTGEQFPEPLPDWLSQPAGNMDPHTLLWLFMGTSKSYNVFGGCVEVIAGVFLLFRKTASLGSLIAIATLTDVLIIDIAYDTLVKAALCHFILIGFYILAPDVKRIFKFFVLNKSSEVTAIPAILPQSKQSWFFYCVKFILIAYAIFFFVKRFSGEAEMASKAYLSGLDGVYDIKEYYKNHEKLSPLITDTARWRKIVINKYNLMSVQFMNDSIAQFGIQPDSATNSLTLSAWNDSSFRSKFSYALDKNGNYIFTGTFRNDSIEFISTKVNLGQAPLLKNKGKIKWVWW